MNPYPNQQQNIPLPDPPRYYPPGTQMPAYAGTYPAQQPMGPSVQLNMGQVPPPPPTGAGVGMDAFGLEPAQLFAEKAIRQAFVSKVFTILTAQLLFTSILISALIFNQDARDYFSPQRSGSLWLILGFILLLTTFLILACVESARRTAPINFILLTLLTIGYSLVAAIYSCQYSTGVVLAAFLTTGVTCALITIFARTTSFDMTNCGTTLCILGLAHLLIGFVLIFFIPDKAKLVMAVLGTLLVSLYLVFDIQLIMGGRKCEISPEEYILAAIMLYTDIINIFIYMLEILNYFSDD